MRVGAIFSQADSGTDPDAIRRWVTTVEAEGFDHVMAYDHVPDTALRRVVRRADGWMPLLLPGLDRTDLRTAVRRLRELAEEAERDPVTLPIHGRVYLGEGWQREVEAAIELGFSHLSFGFNRMANPGLSHDQHLEAVLAAKPELDRITG